MVAAQNRYRWLSLAPKEKYPHTPEITQELDDLWADWLILTRPCLSV